MIQSIKHVVVLFFLLIFAVSCHKDDDTQDTDISLDAISDIATFHGDLKSDAVVVNCQGGPVTTLEDATLKELIGLTQAQSTLFVNVHQVQTKDPEKFKTADITFAQAKTYNKTSIDYVKRVIDHLRGQNVKKVYVLGISFGSFVAQELIASHGIDVADGYLILAGRLDIDEETWKPFSQGKQTKYVYDSEGNYTIQVSDAETSVEQRNMARLASGLGHHRYTNRLDTIADLSKITYVHGERDEAVGRLSRAEIDFLKGKGTKVGVSKKGSHDDAINTGLALLTQVFDVK